jgi:hypothetical protein
VTRLKLRFIEAALGGWLVPGTKGWRRGGGGQVTVALKGGCAGEVTEWDLDKPSHPARTRPCTPSLSKRMRSEQMVISCSPPSPVVCNGPYSSIWSILGKLVQSRCILTGV